MRKGARPRGVGSVAPPAAAPRRVCGGERACAQSAPTPRDAYFCLNRNRRQWLVANVSVLHAFFHPEPAVHFRICSFLVVCSSQSSQKLANTVRQLESHLLCEPRTWCWLRHGYTYVLPHTYCARLDPSLRNHVRMTTHTHTWKNACGAVACVSRACLLGARAPPPIAVSLWGFTELCAAKALMENLTVFRTQNAGRLSTWVLTKMLAGETRPTIGDCVRAGARSNRLNLRFSCTASVFAASTCVVTSY